MNYEINFPAQVSEIVLTYRSNMPKDAPKITSSSDSADVFRRSWDENLMEFQEEFKVMLLNRANKVMGIISPFKGSGSGVVADPRIIFAAALKANAHSIILAHNHPSGNLTPSQADIQLTRKCVEAGKFLELVVLDHVIMTADGYYSFADEGMLGG